MPHEVGADGETVEYRLGQQPVRDWIGRELRIVPTGDIRCVHCDREIKKTFGDGYCYPCFTSLARCDSCIVKPETCHFHKGTCREPDWGQAHCFVPHVVYLAVTSGLKVGVTGAHKVHERWGDQGAVRAQVLARCPNRLTAGKIEHALAQTLPDKTAWQRLLTGRIDEVDLAARREQAIELIPAAHRDLVSPDETEVRLAYTVDAFLAKAKTWNLAKVGKVEGVLTGIKGQYLFIGQAGFNVRRHAGYEVEIQLG